jgi:hypothetical protein
VAAIIGSFGVEPSILPPALTVELSNPITACMLILPPKRMG